MLVVCIHDYSKQISQTKCPKYLELLEATPVTQGAKDVWRYKLEGYPGLWYPERYSPLTNPPEETIVTKGED